jgi:hypothetical protein
MQFFYLINLTEIVDYIILFLSNGSTTLLQGRKKESVGAIAKKQATCREERGVV